MENSRFSRTYLVQYLFASIGNIIFFSEGMQFAWASSSIPKLLGNESYVTVTKEEAKWISNSYMIGDVVGGFFSFVIFNNISRKLSLYVSCLPVLTSLVGILFANSTLVLYFARFIGGVGRNMNLVAIPMYIGEIANPEIRGALGTFTNIFINLGMICVTAITTYVSIRASAIVGVVVATTALTLIHFVPESPYYLLMVSRKDDAKKSLQVLRQSKEVDKELDDLEVSIKKQMEQSESLVKKFSQLFTVRANLKAAFIAIFLKSLQMLTGVSVVIMHCHTIFEQATGSISPDVSTLIYYGVMFATCFFSTSIIDKFERRTLMVISCFLTWLVLTVQGIYFYLNMHGYDLTFLTWLSIFDLIFFSVAYRIGLGTVTFIMCSEIFAVNVKVAGVALSNVAFSLSSLIANIIFDYTEDSFGIHTPFWIFGGLAAVGAIFSAFVLPETKGKTLDEIQQMLASTKKRKEKNVIC